MDEVHEDNSKSQGTKKENKVSQTDVKNGSLRLQHLSRSYPSIELLRHVLTLHPLI